MNCKIEHRDKKEGVEYWCLNHKALSLNSDTQCCCPYKEKYNNIYTFKKEDIKDIKLVYHLDKSTIPDLYINNKLFTGIIKIDNSIIDHKDYGGIMLSKLNNIELESSSCPTCGGIHSDNGKFAYTPHSKHLCVYCGRFFKVAKPNIGNELALYFNFPDIKLKPNTIKITDEIEISYDMFNGILKINNEVGNRLIINNKEIDLIDFLNKALENEY